MLPQVLIEVKIVEVTLNDDSKFGIDNDATPKPIAFRKSRRE